MVPGVGTRGDQRSMVLSWSVPRGPDPCLVSSVQEGDGGWGEFESSSLSEEGGPRRLPWMCTEIHKSQFMHMRWGHSSA